MYISVGEEVTKKGFTMTKISGGGGLVHANCNVRGGGGLEGKMGGGGGGLEPRSHTKSRGVLFLI